MIRRLGAGTLLLAALCGPGRAAPDAPDGWVRVATPWHDAAGAAAALDPRATRLVTASRDDSIRLWDTKTGRQLGRLNHPLDGGEVVLAFAGPARDQVIVAGPDDALRWWIGDRLSAPFAKTEAPVRKIAVAPDGRLAFTTAKALWLATPDGAAKQVAELERPHGVDFSPDGQSIAVGGGEEFGWAKLYRANGTFIRDLTLDTPAGPKHPSAYIMPIVDLAFDPTGRSVAGVGYRTATVWAVATGLLQGQTEQADPGGGPGVQRVMWSPDGSSLFVLNDTALWAWQGDKHVGTVELPWRGHAGYGFDARPAADAVAFVGLSGEVRLVGFDGKPRLDIQGPSVRGLAFAPGAGRVILAVGDALEVRDAATLAVTGRLTEGGPFLALRRCGDQLAVGGKESVTLRDAKTLAVRAEWRGIERPSALGCDAGAVYVGHPDGSIEGWPMETGAKTMRFGAADGKPVTGVAAHGDTVASVGEDGQVHLWRRDGRPLAVLDLPDQRRPLTTAAFGPDGLLYTATGYLNENPVFVWDLAKRAVVRTVGPFRFGAQDLAFAPDGALLTANVASSAQLWPANGAAPITFPAVDGYGALVAMSDDGRTLALVTTGQEKALRVWRRASK